MKFFKAALLFFAAVAMANSAYGQTLYSKVKIEVNSLTEAQKLNGLGVAVDHGVWKKNWFETDLSSDEITMVRNAGFTCEVVIEDVKAFYVNRNKNKSNGVPTTQALGCNPAAGPAQPAGFALGSMGGFFTYQEFLANLDTMAARYPNLITAKAPISNFQTANGRAIYFVKISDNVNQNESSEPQVLYTAVHHAREPLGLSQLIFYMYFLLENYSTNPYVKYVVDNNELFFVPMINPDGYVYNQTTDPNGGGMWRKNRRNNGNGTRGVDPNRNYDYEWGTTGTTTTDGNAETYCGTAPFSEPETQAMKWLIENHNFKLALNYHTYANLLLYPWGYTNNLQCADDALFQAMAADMVTTTELIPQQSSALYEASGDSDDWAYGDTTNKPKVFAQTPELGNDADGFWPQEERIIPVSKMQVDMNLKTAYIAGNYGVVSDKTPTVITTPTGYFNYNLQRLGLQQGSFTVSITPLTNIQSVGNANTHSGLAYGQIVSDSIAYTLTTGILDGAQVRFVLELNNGLITIRDTVTKLYGNSNIVFSNSGAPINDWTTANGWNLSNTTYFSAPNSLTDSPNGNYPNNSTATMVTTQAIDLTAVTYAFLRFKAKWEIEPGYDYVQVSASIDGQNWTPLCGKYTHPGSADQDFEMPLYDGTQSGWVDEEINLGAFVGNQIYIRFIRVADAGVQADGMYVDDLMVEAVTAQPDGIAENTLGNINLFPNPANNVLFVASKQALQYAVFDVLGKQLLSGTTTGNSSVDIAALSKGMYFIRLTADGKQAVKRFVKN